MHAPTDQGFAMKMMNDLPRLSAAELMYACAAVLSPYVLAWLVLAVTQG